MHRMHIIIWLHPEASYSLLTTCRRIVFCLNDVSLAPLKQNVSSNCWGLFMLLSISLCESVECLYQKLHSSTLDDKEGEDICGGGEAAWLDYHQQQQHFNLET